MLLNVNRIKGFGIHATDGDIGRAKEVYFDDRECVIRYLVANTRRWLPGRIVLVPSSALRKPDCARKRIMLTLSKEQVENSSDPDKNRPVNREREYELNQQYGWKIYWTEGPKVFLPADVEPDLAKYDGDPHLQSTNSLTGFHVHAMEGVIGRLVDFIMDDDSWTIRYCVVDTGIGLSRRKALISPQVIHKINQQEMIVYVNLTKEKINACPEYDGFSIAAEG